MWPKSYNNIIIFNRLVMGTDQSLGLYLFRFTKKKKIPSTSCQSLSCLSHESFSLANNEFSFLSIQLECYLEWWKIPNPIQEKVNKKLTRNNNVTHAIWLNQPTATLNLTTQTFFFFLCRKINHPNLRKIHQALYWFLVKHIIT